MEEIGNRDEEDVPAMRGEALSDFGMGDSEWALR